MTEAFQLGFGAHLRAGREEKNLSVAEVAAKLKLTARQVEALEAEDLKHLPSEVFVRGFVRNYARLVDVDPDSLIAPVDVQATVAETITAPSVGVSFAGSSIRRWVVLPLAVLGVFLLLVAMLYHWLRQGEDSLVVAEPAPVSQPQPAPAAPAQIQSPQVTPQTTPVPDGAPTVAPPSAAAEQPAAASPPAPARADAPPPQAPPPADKPAAAKPAALHSLRFEPSQDAWIQVVDGKGSRFSKLVRAGGAESFSGEPPFRLVVGEAAKVRMTYDGHSIDLTPFIGQKVARLTLE
jgi:cytoskeleton protein RodZ